MVLFTVLGIACLLGCVVDALDKYNKDKKDEAQSPLAAVVAEYDEVVQR